MLVTIYALSSGVLQFFEAFALIHVTAENETFLKIFLFSFLFCMFLQIIMLLPYSVSSTVVHIDCRRFEV